MQVDGVRAVGSESRLVGIGTIPTYRDLSVNLGPHRMQWNFVLDVTRPPLAGQMASVEGAVAIGPLRLRLHQDEPYLVSDEGIHMSDIPSFPYRWLWEERQLLSVANLTRADAAEFLRVAAAVPLQVETTTYPLRRANEALADLRAGRLQGAAVLLP